MLTIRLQRTGRRNSPAFRVVVTDSKRSPKAHYLEMVGSYNPKAGTTELNGDRIKYWMGVGAKTSDTVHNMLITKGIVKGKKINVLPKFVAPAVEEVKETPKAEAAPAPAEEAPAEAPAETTDAA